MKRDYTFVGDLSDGIIAACDRIFGYEIFNLGNSNPVELGRFISIVEECLGKKANVKEYPVPPTEVSVTYADLTKSRELLGYDPKTKIEDGMKIFADWYQKNKHLY
jgi:UDP-glucuronate 4-epimerase